MLFGGEVPSPHPTTLFFPMRRVAYVTYITGEQRSEAGRPAGRCASGGEVGSSSCKGGCRIHRGLLVNAPYRRLRHPLQLAQKSVHSPLPRFPSATSERDPRVRPALWTTSKGPCECAARGSQDVRSRRRLVRFWRSRSALARVLLERARACRAVGLVMTGMRGNG
jgi:hypothetical protein